MEVNRFRVPIIILLVAAAAFGVSFIPHPAGDEVLARGAFHSVSHRGKGNVAIVRRNGELILQITDFRTYYRPGLAVLLIDAGDAFENETVRSVEKHLVGPLKSDEGDMEYTLPPDLDLDRFRAVTIWSERYEVNFTTAPLQR